MTQERGGGSGSEGAFIPVADGLAVPSRAHARAFLGLLRAGEQLDRLLDTDLRAAHGIGLRGYEVLLHLAAFTPDRRATMTQLIRQTPLSQSRTSRLVADLEAHDLVRRTGDAQDSRVVVVCLTDEGRRVLRQAQQTHHDGLQQWLFSRFTYDELVQLGDLTSRLLADEKAIG